MIHGLKQTKKQKTGPKVDKILTKTVAVSCGSSYDDEKTKAQQIERKQRSEELREFHPPFVLTCVAEMLFCF